MNASPLPTVVEPKASRAADTASELASDTTTVPAHLAVDLRAPLAPLPRSSASATVLATLGVIGALWGGQRFIIPLAAGLMLAMLVAPLVLAVQRIVRVRMLATLTALAIVMATLVLGAFAFGGQLLRVTERVPEMISLVAQRVAMADPDADSVLTRARNSLRELDRAADSVIGGKTSVITSRPARAQRNAAPVASAPASAPTTFSDGATVALRETAVSGSNMLMKFAADLMVILFIAFFVLAGGNTLSQRLVDQWGYDPAARAHAEAALRECARQVRLYAGVLLITNSIIGTAVWLAFMWSGLPDAAGWGVTAAVLHVIPYLGMSLLMALGAAESFLAHGTFAAAFGMAFFIVMLSTLIGTVVTAWLQGRAAKMNPAAVFIGLVFWGALWGLWGLFLGPALVVLFKVVAEHSRAGRRLARLMQG